MRLNTNKLTEQELSRRGCIFDRVERRQGPILRDFLGCLDYLYFMPLEPGVVGVQVTSKPHMADRLRKVVGTPAMKDWLMHHTRRVEVWAWGHDGSLSVRTVKYDDVCEN